MQIILNWKNRTLDATATNIYRSTSEFSAAQLPAIYKTIDPALESFVDTDVVKGTTYYYRTEAVRGGNRAVSAMMKAQALRRTGPGPQELIAGDIEEGFYGEVTHRELVDTATLRSLVKMTVGSIAIPFPTWLKFAYKGKILFIAKQVLAVGVSWNDLHAAKLVYGLSDVGGVNHKTVANIKNENFIVRLMKGGNSLPNSPFTLINSFKDSVGLNGSEWNDLFYRVCSASAINSTKSKFANYSAESLTTSGSCTTCQELLSASYCLVRGAGLSPGYIGTAHAYAVGSPGPEILKVDDSSASYSPGWRPVLEWVP